MPNELEHIFKKMGINKENGLFKFGDELPDYPLRIKSSLKAIDYDAIYDVNNKPLIIFKYFKNQTNIEQKIYQTHKDIWNFGETPILFIVLPHEIRVYNAFQFKRENNSVWKTLSLNNSSISDELNEFSYMNLMSGKFWKKNEKEFNKKTRVHNYLLDNLNQCRLKLINLNLPFNIINSLLSRLIFSRYLSDKNILDKDFFESNYDCSFVELIKDKKELYSYFNYIKNRFNGDIFKLEDLETELVKTKHLNLLSRFFNGDNIGSGQSVLFDVYDFSIIPIELVSNIYETFIHSKGLNSNKTYYTPIFLADYILKNTLEEKINNSDSKYKILDPSCGSGIFLVESLRKIVEKKKSDLNRKLTANELKDIVKECIFGVDLDKDAINISIFSICLTLLDYIDPNEMNNFSFPKLKNKNLFVADFFDTKHPFNEILKEIDIIIGNPPWGKYNGTHIEYCLERDIPIPNKQIALCFLVRSRDFANENTEIALIITSKSLYNLRDESFRKYFLKNFYINEIFEFSSVRKKVFANAIGPGTIIFYKPAFNNDTKKNLVKYISLKQNRFFKLFKTIVIEKQDIKYIQQHFFLEYDWIWKVILYGTVNDFQLVKRLKEEFKSFDEIIKKRKTIIYGVGLQCTQSDNPIDSSNLIGKNFINTNHIKRYHIEPKHIVQWKKSEVHRIRDINLFKPPHIIMRVSLNNKDYKSLSTYSDEELIFTHSSQAIKGGEKDKDFLKSLLALLNSKFFSYYMFMTGSSVGIERPQVRIGELKDFPTIINYDLVKKVDAILNIYKEYNYSNISNIKKELNKIEEDIDNLIYDSYGLTEDERELIDYATEIIIPIRKGKEKPFEPPKKEILFNYVKIFTDHFENILDNEYLCAEIYDTGYFITIHFKNSLKKINKPKFVSDKNFEQTSAFLSEMSLSEFTKDLYFFKDIKGFEKDSFYVIKPKENKNWHRAVARSDLDEFINAIMKSGLNSLGG